MFDEAKRLDAVPYDIEGAPVTHEWEKCSFDALIAAFELQDPALEMLATIVRGADTSRLEIAPQAAGLLAVSLGLSQLHADDDHAMLQAALPVYDALYAWCRDGQGERHTWVAHAGDHSGDLLRHPRESGDPRELETPSHVDSRVRGNDGSKA